MVKRRGKDPFQSLIKPLVLGGMLFGALYCVYALGKAILPYLPFIGGGIVAIGLLVALGYFYRKVRRKARDKEIDGELEPTIRNCLRDMDTLAKAYTNEDDANKELAAMLVAKGIDAKLHNGIGDGAEADIIVGRTIIESKLDPRTTDIDRLHGQTIRYLRKFDRLIIVVFGELKRELEERIQRDIIGQDHDRISLVSLNEVDRKRKTYDSPKTLLP